MTETLVGHSAGILFYLFAALALVAALVMVGQRNPLYSAFALIVVMCSLSVLFGLLGSPFIAALQIVVYAGAVMVLFLFVLMLLNVRPELRRERRGGALKPVAIGLGLLLVLQIGAVLQGAARTSWAEPFDASSANVARVLFSPPYLYVFEATSVLIVAALVGAVVLARKEPR